MGWGEDRRSSGPPGARSSAGTVTGVSPRLGGRAEAEARRLLPGRFEDQPGGLREGVEGVRIGDAADIDHAELVLDRREDDVDDPSAGPARDGTRTRP